MTSACASQMIAPSEPHRGIGCEYPECCFRSMPAACILNMGIPGPHQGGQAGTWPVKPDTEAAAFAGGKWSVPETLFLTVVPLNCTKSPSVQC